MYARSKMHSEYGKNITAQELNPTDLGGRMRPTDTFKSNFNFTPITNTKQEDMQTMNRRERQFVGNPVQPPATRQSYQDSDIFGTKGIAADTVQQSAVNKYAPTKLRQSDTYRSTFGDINSGAGPADPTRTPVTRKNEKWQSSVFEGPTDQNIRQRDFERKGAGREGLYGDQDSEKWKKRQVYAGEVSQREETRPPKFDEQGADDRKAKELHGNSKYQGVKKEYVRKAEYAGTPDTFNQKANQLQSHLLTHDDDDFREERTKNFNKQPRINGASNASWNDQAGLQKPQNVGKIDAYKMRQNQLESQVLEQTDYSQFAPMNKKKVDFDNIDHKPQKTGSPRKKLLDSDLAYANVDWTNTDTKNQINKDYTNYDRKDMKHKQMVSSMDGHAYNQDTRAPPRDIDDDYQQKLHSNVPGRTPGASILQKNLASTMQGHDALRFYDKPLEGQNKNVIDIDLSGLPADCDERQIKRVANVKHIIQAQVDQDNLRGICKGDGRIKIRLNETESLEQVRLNFIRAGYIVRVHEDDARKRPVLTGEKKDKGEHKYFNHKDKKAYEMSTKYDTRF